MRIAFVLVIIAAAAAVEASFAAAPGFSGRTADCTSCHRPPLEGDDALVVVEGIPSVWDLEATYDWTVRVDNGPTTLPEGPQAGFEIEVLDGTMIASGDGTRRFHDKQATYTETGVFQRAWDVQWQAPDLSVRPAPITVWVAGMAANGNHNVMLNASDAGEHGDSVDTDVFHIPPSAAAQQAWRDLPLQAPRIDAIEPTATGHRIDGAQTDGNATTIEFRVGDIWQPKPASGAWRLQINGATTVDIRSTGADRYSDVVTIDLLTAQVQVADDPDNESTPAPFILLPILIALWRRP